MDWFGDNPWLAWLGVALMMGAIEVATVDFVFLMFAGGALAAALVSAFGAGLPLQVLTFVVVAAVLLVLVRPLIKRHLMVPDISGTIGARSLVGRNGRVLQTVTATDGRVKLGGEVWSARTPEGSAVCQPGQEVRVLSIDGATVIVTSDTAAQKSE